jgi:arsenate reductase (glutaredoxin)
MKLYGIANCDTVRRARAWLDARAVDYEWIDFRREPPAAGLLEQWSHGVGWEALVNRRGTTWRRLGAREQAAITDAASAFAAMAANPSLIRRPVVDDGAAVSVGFAADDWSRRFGRTA